MASPSSFSRRALLRRGLLVGGTLTGMAVAAVALEERQRASVPSSTTTTTLGPPTAANWRTLANSLTGTLVRPGNPTYPQDALLYNAKFVDLHPRAIAYCANASDVARCVDFATSHQIPFAARSGGHSYGGYSSSSGLVVDVSRLASIEVDTATNTAIVGAGARLIDVYNALGHRHRLLPSGSCPSVGIAGITLGGGIGVFGRKYGLTSDNLRSLQLVTSDARTITASESDHADLLWASRGGGGGNYGIATSFEFTVHPMPDVTLFTLQYPWAAASTTLGAWQRWIANAPDELWSNCQLLSQGSIGYLVQVSGVYCGGATALESLLTPLRREIATTPSYQFLGSREYLAAMEIEAGCSGLTIAACHLATQSPHGTLGRSAYSAKSSYVDAPMSDARTQLMVTAVENLAGVAPSVGGGLAFDAYGGAINRVASGATAFVHRDALAGIQATYSWSGATPASEIDAGAKWLAWLGAHVFDPATGAYQNYIDPTLADWKAAYYGTNLARLETIKSRYDPENHLTFAQSIPPLRDS